MILFPEGHGCGNAGQGHGTGETVVETVAVVEQLARDVVACATQGMGGVSFAGPRGSATRPVTMGPPGLMDLCWYWSSSSSLLTAAAAVVAAERGSAIIGPPGWVYRGGSTTVASSEGPHVGQRPQPAKLLITTEAVHALGEVTVAVVGGRGVGPVGSPGEQIEVGEMHAWRTTRHKG